MIRSSDKKQTGKAPETWKHEVALEDWLKFYRISDPNFAHNLKNSKTLKKLKKSKTLKKFKNIKKTFNLDLL